MRRLEGKIAVITGGSRGIGSAVALAFAREGAALALVGHRDEAALRAVREQVLSLGVDAFSALCDVGNRQEMERLVQDAMDRWGRIDILVNNAGVLKLARFEDISESQWDETVRVHLKGTFNGCKAVVPVMKRQHSGKIVNVIGPAALRPSIGVSDYAAAKGGIIALTSNLANELKPFDIQVNCISPVADTRMTQAIAAFRGEQGVSASRHPMPPDVVAPAFVFFACSDSDYITGQVLAFSRK
jgi:3-oxoacyl-[acyl-carrier protein] reductase